MSGKADSSHVALAVCRFDALGMTRCLFLKWMDTFFSSQEKQIPRTLRLPPAGLTGSE